MQSVFQRGKRRFPRRKFRRPLGIMIHGTYHFSRGEEIGEGGMLIVSPVAVPVLSDVLMTFIIPGDEPVVARATVRYQKEGALPSEYKLGLEFTGLGFKQKKKIRDYIAAKTEQEAINDQKESQVQ